MHLEALDLNILLVQLFLDAAHLARKICLDGVELLDELLLLQLVISLHLAEFLLQLVNLLSFLLARSPR